MARCRRAALRRLAELGGTTVSGPPKRWNLGRLRSIDVETGADAGGGGEVGDSIAVISSGEAGCSLDGVGATAGEAAGVLGGRNASDGSATGAGRAASLAIESTAAACEALIRSIADGSGRATSAGDGAGVGE